MLVVPLVIDVQVCAFVEVNICPLEEPTTRELVPEGLTVVTRAAAEMPMVAAIMKLVSVATLAASSSSKCSIAPDAIPVMPTPIRASLAVVCSQMGRR